MALSAHTVSARGSFLYFRTLIDNSQYVIESTSSGDRGHSSRYDWDPGVRAALCVTIAPRNFEIEAEGTYLHNEGSGRVPKSLTLDTPRLISPFPQIFSEGATPYNLHASYDLDLRYQLYHLLLGTSFTRSSSHFRIFMGPSAAFIEQRWDLKYFALDNRTLGKIDLDYKSGGIRMGGNLKWLIGKGVSLSSQLALGGYLGSYDKIDRFIETFSSTGQMITLRNLRIDETRFAFNLQFIVGPSFDHQFKRMGLHLFAGYEINPWFNLCPTQDSSLLTLQGLNVTLGFDW